MRFAAVNMPKTEPLRSPAAEFVRKLLSAPKEVASAPADAHTRIQEPPLDLDQRVRLAGEW